MSVIKLGTKVTDAFGQEGIVIGLRLEVNRVVVEYKDGSNRIREIQSLLITEEQ